MGPCRGRTQVEISATDARALGIPAVIRESGDIVGTPGCKIVGPKGEVEISEGVIVAKRHIHLNLQEAEEYGLKDRETVMVKIDTPERSLVFDDVVVRVRKDFSAAMHIDTDEANAGNIGPETYGTIIKKH